MRGLMGRSSTLLLLKLLLLAGNGCGPMAPPLAKPASSRPATPPITTTAPGEETPAAQSQAPAIAVVPVEEPDSSPPPARTPRKFIRPDDTRPRHDDRQLAELGIRTVESPHLKLYSDLPEELLKPLPKLVDQLFAALTDFFGPVPENRAGTAFQLTGYLIRDRALFRETGLLPDDLPAFEHGRHRGDRFWLYDRTQDYYRRHLLLHEATHCFMTIQPEIQLPAWFLEGTAELFGTHAIDDTGTARFRVFPANKDAFDGWGRVPMIQQDLARGKFYSFASIDRLDPNEFLKPEPYAWTWGMCQFLDRHPAYQAGFKAAMKQLWTGRLPEEYRELVAADPEQLAADWLLFAGNIQYGFDIERGAVEWRPAMASPMKRVEIQAARGWQATGFRVEQGVKYRVTARGQFHAGEPATRWVSEANGISIRYFKGQPLGRLLACIRPETGPLESLLEVIPLGNDADFTAPHTGQLLLRLNDAWNELADNSGGLTVEIHAP